MAEYPQIGVRVDDDLIKRLDEWRKRQDDLPSRPEAIRRLVELGLTVRARPKQTFHARAARAHEAARKQLDQLADQSASAEEQASRKRRLLKGPEEFRDIRLDRPKKK
jgi:hypothetical protein